MYHQADKDLKQIFQKGGTYSSTRQSRELEHMPSIQQIEQDVKRRKYYGNLIGYTTTQTFSHRSNKFDPLKGQLAYVDAQLAQDTLPQIEYREELRDMEMNQVRAQQKRNENKFRQLEVISPGEESKYSQSVQSKNVEEPTKMSEMTPLPPLNQTLTSFKGVDKEQKEVEVEPESVAEVEDQTEVEIEVQKETEPYTDLEEPREESEEYSMEAEEEIANRDNFNLIKNKNGS